MANFIDRWVPPLQTIHVPLLSVLSERKVNSINMSCKPLACTLLFSPLIKEFKEKFMQQLRLFSGVGKL